MTERDLQRLLSRQMRKQALVDLNPNAFVNSPLASFQGPMVQHALHPTYTFGQGVKDMMVGARDRTSQFLRAALPGGGHRGANSMGDNLWAGFWKSNHPFWDRRNITEPFRRMQEEPDYQHATRKVTGLFNRWRVPGMQGDSINQVVTNRLIPDHHNGTILPPWWNSYLNTGAHGPSTSQAFDVMQREMTNPLRPGADGKPLGALPGFRRPVESSINAF